MEEHFIDETLPEGAVIDGESLSKDTADEFDFVVVGSGLVVADAAAVFGDPGVGPLDHPAAAEQ